MAMTSEDRLLVIGWICFAFIACSAIGAIFTYNTYISKVWADNIAAAISHGADPVAARCAITHENSDICIIVAAQKK